MKQILVYFALAYLISWIVWLPLYGPTLGVGGLPVLPFHHGLGGLGPLIASVLSTWIFAGRQGIKELLKKSIQPKPVLYLVIASLSPFLLAFVAALISYFVDKAPVDLSGLLHYKEFPDLSLLTFFIYNLVFFGFGEEVGWRGFALPRLQNRFNALTSAIVLTLLWALWHWPLFLYRPGYLSMDFAGAMGWIFSLLTGSVLLTWLYNSSRGNILICAVFHSTIDIAFTADFANKNRMNYMGFLITVWGVVTILIFKARNLSRTERQKIET